MYNGTDDSHGELSARQVDGIINVVLELLRLCNRLENVRFLEWNLDLAVSVKTHGACHYVDVINCNSEYRSELLVKKEWNEVYWVQPPYTELIHSGLSKISMIFKPRHQYCPVFLQTSNTDSAETIPYRKSPLINMVIVQMRQEILWGKQPTIVNCCSEMPRPAWIISTAIPRTVIKRIVPDRPLYKDSRTVETHSSFLRERVRA